MSLIKFDIDTDSAWDGLIKPLLFYSITIIVLILGLVYFISKNISCPQLGNALQKETKFNFLAGGCFIKLSNGSWISSDNYNGVNIENK